MVRKIIASFILGSLSVKLLYLAILLSAIVITGTFIATSFFNMQYNDAVWWVWTQLMDAGFIGINTQEPVAQKVVGSTIAILGLIVIAGALIGLAQEIFSRMLQELLKGNVPEKIQGHTIIAGHGRTLPGFVQAIQPEKSVGPIILVVSDPKQFDEVRRAFNEKNITVIVDAINSVAAQERLQISKARRILILESSGITPGKILELIGRIDKERSEQIRSQAPTSKNLEELNVYVEINDRQLQPALQTTLRATKTRTSKMEVNFININDVSARLALLSYPLDNVQTPMLALSPCLIIVGWSVFADSLLQSAMVLAHYPQKPTKIAVVDSNYQALRQHYESAMPGITDPEYQKNVSKITFHPEIPATTSSDVVTVAVCGDDCDRVFAKAIEISGSSRKGVVQIYVQVSEDSGYRGILEKVNVATGSRLKAVGAKSEALRLAETLDRFARLSHQRYLRQREENGSRSLLANGSYENPEDYEWSDLDEVHRNWNRTPIDHAEIKMRILADYHELPRFWDSEQQKSIGTARPRLVEIVENLCGHLPKAKTEHRDDLELLSKLEHDRWMGEKISEGWTYAETKNVSKRATPYLVPYGNLSEDVKHFDREQVCHQLKGVLEKSNLEEVQL